MAGLGTEAHPGLGQKGLDPDLELKDGGMVLGADGEVPVLACHQLVPRLGSLGKACFLTSYPPRASHAGPAPSFLGNTREQVNRTLSSRE